MGQNACTSVIVSLCVLALSLVLLRCFTMLSVAPSQTKPGPPSAPPATVSVIEVSPKALPLYTEYTGITDALETVEIRAGVAPDSQVETFAALQLEIDSWCWQGVPFYIRAGKCLPVTCAEILVRLHQPPTMYHGFNVPPNYCRFRISPDVTFALDINAMAPVIHYPG
jgi:Glucose-6-phosphate dehydrogenase, C-terminal domain